MKTQQGIRIILTEKCNVLGINHQSKKISHTDIGCFNFTKGFQVLVTELILHYSLIALTGTVHLCKTDFNRSQKAINKA